MNMKKGLTLGLSIVMAATLLVGCGGGKTEEKKPAAAGKKLAGSVKIDGSSTVFPISEAMAEEFRKINPDVKVTVGESGTTGGMKKFVPGEIDIADASRPIRGRVRLSNGMMFPQGFGLLTGSPRWNCPALVTRRGSLSKISLASSAAAAKAAHSAITCSGS